MSVLPTLEQPQFLLDVNDGFSATKYLAVASLTWLVYDHVTSLDQEIEFLWGGAWSLTRILYFLNRYIPPLVFLLQMLYFFMNDVSLEFCTKAIKTTTTFEVIGLFVVEAVLVTRVYYLWSHNRMVQTLLCICFVVAVSVATGFVGWAVDNFNAVRLPPPLATGCLNLSKKAALYWPIFLPTFLLQSLLFALTLIRVMRPLRMRQNTSVIRRLIRDGGVFYLVVCVSVAFSGISSLELQHPQISIPALYSNMLLAIHSICASHLMLSIHSLASDLGSDPTFILSNIEMSRVAWRKGSTENEFVVEITEQPPLELIDIDPLTGVQTKGMIRATRVGVWDSSPTLPTLGFRTYMNQR